MGAIKHGMKESSHGTLPLEQELAAQGRFEVSISSSVLIERVGGTRIPVCRIVTSFLSASIVFLIDAELRMLTLRPTRSDSEIGGF